MSELFKQGQKEAIQEMFNKSKSAYQVNRMRELMNFGKKSAPQSSSEKKEELNEDALNEYMAVAKKDYYKKVSGTLKQLIVHLASLQFNARNGLTNNNDHWSDECIKFYDNIASVKIANGNKPGHKAGELTNMISRIDFNKEIIDKFNAEHFYELLRQVGWDENIAREIMAQETRVIPDQMVGMFNNIIVNYLSSESYHEQFVVFVNDVVDKKYVNYGE